MDIDKKEDSNLFTMKINYKDLDFIQEALAKQETRKLIKSNRGLKFCPSCESSINNKEYKYCPYCGQKIKI